MAHNGAATIARALSANTLGISSIVALSTDARKRYPLVLIGGIGLIIIGLLVLAFEIAELLGYKTPWKSLDQNSKTLHRDTYA